MVTGTKKKSIRIENAPNLRICMDTKLNSHGISKTCVSGAPWAVNVHQVLKSDGNLIIPIQWV